MVYAYVHPTANETRDSSVHGGHDVFRPQTTPKRRRLANTRPIHDRNTSDIERRKPSDAGRRRKTLFQTRRRPTNRRDRCSTSGEKFHRAINNETCSDPYAMNSRPVYTAADRSRILLVGRPDPDDECPGAIITFDSHVRRTSAEKRTRVDDSTQTRVVGSNQLCRYMMIPNDNNNDT